MISFFRILLQHRDLLVLILATIISLFLLFSNDTPNVVTLRGNVTDIFVKFLKPQQWYRNILSVKEENRMLREKVTQLNLHNLRLKYYVHENDMLKEMLKFSKESQWDLKPANIIRQSFSPSINTFTINIGNNEVITKDKPVIDMNGLIGKTHIIGNNSTIIQVLTDKNFRVSIRVGKNKTLGIFVPTHGSYGILEGIPKSQSVVKNDIVVTSGISDIYPINIPVAKVTSVTVNPNQLFQDIAVEILADIYNPEYVFIIK